MGNDHQNGLEYSVNAKMTRRGHPMAHVFLSYSREDIWAMRYVTQLLLVRKFHVWSDDTLTPGTPSWKMAIERAIDNAGCIVVLFSKSAKKSDWVRRELDYAEAQKRPIIPILLSGNEAESIPFGFNTYQWIDMRKGTETKVSDARLISELHKYLPPSEFNLDKVANLYWAAHDIQELKWLTLYGRVTDIERRILLAKHHLEELGFVSQANALNRL